MTVRTEETPLVVDRSRRARRPPHLAGRGCSPSPCRACRSAPWRWRSRSTCRATTPATSVSAWARGLAFMAVRLVDMLLRPVHRRPDGPHPDAPRALSGLAALRRAAAGHPGLHAVPGAGRRDAGLLVGWLFIYYLGTSVIALSHASWASVIASKYHDRSRVFGAIQMVSTLAATAVLFVPALVGSKNPATRRAGHGLVHRHRDAARHPDGQPLHARDDRRRALDREGHPARLLGDGLLAGDAPHHRRRLLPDAGARLDERDVPVLLPRIRAASTSAPPPICWRSTSPPACSARLGFRGWRPGWASTAR